MTKKLSRELALLAKGEKVAILDYPFGKPTKLSGVVKGILGSGFYNILMDNGLNEGNLVKYKYWSLQQLK